MSLDFDYSRDTEFSKLLARRTDVNLTGAALELARDAYPHLEFAGVFEWITARANELRSVIARTTSEREAIELVAKNIAVEHGIVGSPDAYDLADSSYLNRVIERRSGLPIAVSLLHMAVCRELRLDLRGVAAPQRFITRIETPEGSLFVDCFAGCRILNVDETLSWLEELTHCSKRELSRTLKPVGARLIITRMLNNLKSLYADQQNWPALWKVQSRLTALSPSDYAERRDLAITAVRVDQTACAIRLLNELILDCPAAERPMLKAMREDAGLRVHLWN